MWEPETTHELDKNSYNTLFGDNESPDDTEEDMDPDTESDGWRDFLSNAFLQLLSLIFEVLMS